MLEWLLTYAGQVIGGLLTILALWKDAKDYGELSKRWGRAIVTFVAVGILLFFCASIYLTHLSRIDAARDKAAAEAESVANKARIQTLSDQILQMSRDRTTAENGFRNSFAELSEKIASLQTKAATQELSQELDKTRTELREAQSKLVPPRANVFPSFWSPELPTSQLPAVTTTAKLINNTISVDFFAFNKSDTAAMNGVITIRICNACKYAREPEGSRTIKGVEEHDREFPFMIIYPHAGLHKCRAEIIPPEGLEQIPFDTTASCQNCEPQPLQRFIVIVQK